jgi:hypothetical protein
MPIRNITAVKIDEKEGWERREKTNVELQL